MHYKTNVHSLDVSIIKFEKKFVRIILPLGEMLYISTESQQLGINKLAGHKPNCHDGKQPLDDRQQITFNAKKSMKPNFGLHAMVSYKSNRTDKLRSQKIFNLNRLSIPAQNDTSLVVLTGDNYRAQSAVSTIELNSVSFSKPKPEMKQEDIKLKTSRMHFPTSTINVTKEHLPASMSDKKDCSAIGLMMHMNDCLNVEKNLVDNYLYGRWQVDDCSLGGQLPSKCSSNISDEEKLGSFDENRIFPDTAVSNVVPNILNENSSQNTFISNTDMLVDRRKLERNLKIEAKEPINRHASAIHSTSSPKRDISIIENATKGNRFFRALLDSTDHDSIDCVESSAAVNRACDANYRPGIYKSNNYAGPYLNAQPPIGALEIITNEQQQYEQNIANDKLTGLKRYPIDCVRQLMVNYSDFKSMKQQSKNKQNTPLALSLNAEFTASSHHCCCCNNTSKVPAATSMDYINNASLSHANVSKFTKTIMMSSDVPLSNKRIHSWLTNVNRSANSSGDSLLVTQSVAKYPTKEITPSLTDKPITHSGTFDAKRQTDLTDTNRIQPDLKAAQSKSAVKCLIRKNDNWFVDPNSSSDRPIFRQRICHPLSKKKDAKIKNKALLLRQLTNEVPVYRGPDLCLRGHEITARPPLLRHARRNGSSRPQTEASYAYSRDFSDVVGVKRWRQK